MRAVLDTNLLISALLGSPTCRAAIKACDNPQIELVSSPVLLEELCFTIAKPKFNELIGTKNRDELLSFLKSSSTIVKPLLIP